MKLYELTDAYTQLQALAEEADDGSWGQALADLTGSIEEKCDQTARLIRTLEAEAEALKTEAKRMLETASSRARRVEDLKSYLGRTLDAVGMDRVKGPLFTVSLQSSPPACHVFDETAIPELYQRVIPALVLPNSLQIIAYWRETGQQVPGAMVTVGKHVRIR